MNGKISIWDRDLKSIFPTRSKDSRITQGFVYCGSCLTIISIIRQLFHMKCHWGICGKR